MGVLGSGCAPTGSGDNDGNPPGERHLAGRVVDAASGLPIEGATVTVGGLDTSTQTVDDGTYEFTALTDAALDVTFSATGYDTQTAAVDAAATTLDARLVLSGSGTIHGRVTDAVGQAVSNAQVSVYGTSIAATTDPGGQYSLPGVPPGLLTIRASAAGFRSRDHSSTLAQDGDLALNFQLDRAPGSQAVSGTVTDAVTGYPIPGAQVTVGNTTVATNAEGLFLITEVAGQRTTVSVAATGYYATSASVELSGTETSVSIAMIPDDYTGPPAPPG